MLVTYFSEPIPYIVIDEFYNEEQLRLIWEELDFLCYNYKLDDPEETGSAKDDNGNILKKNSGIFLDDLYSKREISNILNVNRKIFLEFHDIFKRSPSWFFKTLQCNLDHTLVSYYENSDYYSKHFDKASVTCLSWFFKEPKSFNGGNLNLHYNEETFSIEVNNNRMVIIPSQIYHSVDKIEMKDENLNKKLGRFCITQFLKLV